MKQPIRSIHFSKDIDGVDGGVFLLNHILEHAPKTIEAWIKLDADSQGGAILSDFFAMDPVYTTVKWIDARLDTPQFSLHIDKEGHPCCMWFTGVVGSFEKCEGSVLCVIEDVDVRNGEWTHIAFVRDSEAKTVRFYLNGQLHSTIDAVTADYTPEQAFGLGGNLVSAGKMHFRGELARVATWNICRTPEQIDADADGDIAPNAEGLEAYWSLEEDGKTAEVLEEITGRYPATKRVFWISPEEYEIPPFDFSMILLPDVQVMTQYYPEKLSHMTQWIVDHKEALNLQMVMPLGDLTNGNFYGSREEGVWEEEARRAAAAFKNFELGGVPYSLSFGNHDYEEKVRVRNTDLLNSHFSSALMHSYDCFGGAFEEDKVDNAYFLFDVNGCKWMVMALEFGPRDAVIEWADRVIGDHPDYHVLLTSHDGVTKTGRWSYRGLVDNATYYRTISSDSNSGEELWNKLLKKHHNITAFFNGHWIHELIRHRTDIGDHGNVVHSFMMDFTGVEYDRRGCETMVLLTFGKDGRTLTLSAFSVLKGFYFGYENQITFSADEFI